MSAHNAIALLAGSPASLAERIERLGDDAALVAQLVSLNELDPMVESTLGGFAYLAVTNSRPAQMRDDVIPPSEALVFAGVDGVTSRAIHPFGCVGTTQTFPFVVETLGATLSWAKDERERRAVEFLNHPKNFYLDVFRNPPFVAKDETPALSQEERAADMGFFLSVIVDLLESHGGRLRVIGMGSGVKLIHIQAAALGGLGPQLPTGIGGDKNVLAAEMRDDVAVPHRWKVLRADGTQIGVVEVLEQVHWAHISAAEAEQHHPLLARRYSNLFAGAVGEGGEDVQEITITVRADYQPGAALASWNRDEVPCWSPRGDSVTHFDLEAGKGGVRSAKQQTLTETKYCRKCGHAWPPGSLSRGAFTTRQGFCPAGDGVTDYVRREQGCNVKLCADVGFADYAFCVQSTGGGCAACKARVAQ